MQNVKNRKCIRRLSVKALQAAKIRNRIAVSGIVLTTVLFTAVFTIGLSVMKSFEQQNFRQVGGDSHGVFKNLKEEEAAVLKEDPLIREAGLRWMLGMPQKAPFLKSHVEVSYIEPKLAKHMFCTPKEGRLPKEGTMEAATDTRVLKLLGVEQKIGETFTLTYFLGSNTAQPKEITQTFTLSGWWEYDSAGMASHVLVPRSYAEDVLKDYEKQGENDQTGEYDLYVMFSDSFHIEDNLKEILSRHGYQNEDTGKENFISTGVNWGYAGAQFSSNVDFGTLLGFAAALLLIVFSGYLIIYNIFRISVSGDIRFYGLLKTIGMTKKQIRSIVRQQVFLLSLTGIPAGLFLGWIIGAVLTPKVMAVMSYKTAAVSLHPVIFIGAALFSLITVFLSSRKPAKIAGAVSPVEAVRYTESFSGTRKEKKREKETTVFGMAIANLFRTKGKTVLVILSLSLSVVLLNVTYTFTKGFDMDKYLRQWVCTDFIAGHANYFSFRFGSDDEGVTEAMIADIEKQGGVTESGRIYGQTTLISHYVPEALIKQSYQGAYQEEKLQEFLGNFRKDDAGDYEDRLQVYGMEELPLSKLNVLEGDLSELKNQDTILAVVLTDDYGKPIEDSNHYQVGDKAELLFVEEFQYVDSRTGEPFTEEIPEEFLEMKILKSHTKTYTVGARVSMLYTMSYRFYGTEQMVLPAAEFREQTGTNTVMTYLFNTTQNTNEAMDHFLRDYTENTEPEYSYESKQSYVKQFEEFRNMFLLMGGMLSLILGMIGILNFVNAEITGIISRKREFAVMQAVGMTEKQLKQVLVLEGCAYGMTAVFLACLWNLFAAPLISNGISNIFWFYTYHFTLLPIIGTIPVFLVLGCMIPLLVNRRINQQSIVERIRYDG